MRINTQFPVAVHILSTLAFFDGDAVPSELIAKSVGTNPVVVRRIMAQLRRARIVDTQPGVKGGVLRKDPRDITLLAIYNAVRPQGDTLFDIHENQSRECPVGAHFSEAIRKPLARAQRAMEKELAAATLHDVLRPIVRRNDRPGPEKCGA